jgi:hypothetical protein
VGKTHDIDLLLKYSPERVELILRLIFNPFMVVIPLIAFPWASPTVIDI